MNALSDNMKKGGNWKGYMDMLTGENHHMKDKFLSEIRKVSGPCVQTIGLEEFLVKSDFFNAPASQDHHLCKKGGLAEHSWNVYTSLKGIVAKYAPETPERSVIFCGLLHDVCKANFYKYDFIKNKKNDAGEWEKVYGYKIDDADPLGHGEKSVIIIQRYLALSEDEALAIRWHMGAWDAEGFVARKTLGNAMDKCALLRALMLADQLATFFIEARTQK